MIRAAAVVVVLASGAVAAQQPFRAGIEAVYLDVTVIAPNGDLVTGLTKDDFEIYDEGVKHEVAIFSSEPSPISVGVLIDASRSMRGDRITAALVAARAMGQALQPRDLWSVYTFDDRVRRVIGWRPYDPSVLPAIKEIPIRGGTELFTSVIHLIDQMKSTPHRKRALLVITDGADNAIAAAQRQRSRRVGPSGGVGAVPMIVDHSDRAVRELREGEVLVYGLGLDWEPAAGVESAVHVPSLRKLAEPTGGAVATVRTLADAEGAARSLATELRLQYTLGFYPQKAADGQYRRVKVVAKNPDYRVRTRAGYLAARPR